MKIRADWFPLGKRCEYYKEHVTEYGEPYDGECGESSTHKVWWEDRNNAMFVCEEHLNRILEDEEKMRDENNQG
jgi:hypothetical protein